MSLADRALCLLISCELVSIVTMFSVGQVTAPNVVQMMKSNSGSRQQYATI